MFTSDLKEGTQAKLQLELLSQHLAWRRRASSLWAKRRLGRYLEETLSKRGPFQRKMPPHTDETLGSPRGHTGRRPESSSSLSVYCVVWAVAPNVRATEATAEFSIVCAERGGMIVT